MRGLAGLYCNQPMDEQMPKPVFPPRWPCYADMTVRFQLETTIPSGLMDLYKLSKCRLCDSVCMCVCVVA